MHDHTEPEDRVLDSAHYATFHQVFIVDRTPMAIMPAIRSYPNPTEAPEGGIVGAIAYKVSDLLPYDPFLSCDINADLEMPVVEATFRFALGRNMPDVSEPGTTILTNLSPYMLGTTVGIPGGLWVAGRPLFDPGRYIALLTKCVSLLPGETPADELPWRPVFIGRIDSADPATEEGVLIVECRDIMSDLLDLWIEPGPSGGFVMEEKIIEHLLVDLIELGTRELEDDEGIKGLVSDLGQSGMLVPSYFQQPEATLLAMRRAGLLNGWDLRGRWFTIEALMKIPGLGIGGVVGNDWYPEQFLLWYYAPDRALTGPRQRMTPGRYLNLSGLAKNRDEVRNVVEVTPSDPPRTTVKVSDQASIDKYGRRYVGITEDISSGIRTSAQATALALAVLSDLKEPKVIAEIEMRYQPFLEVNDVLELEPDFEHHDNDLIVSVSGYSHSILQNGDARTILRTRDVPSAANKAWRLGKPKMEYISTQPPTGWAPEGATWRQVEAGIDAQVEE